MAGGSVDNVCGGRDKKGASDRMTCVGEGVVGAGRYLGTFDYQRNAANWDGLGAWSWDQTPENWGAYR